MPLVNQIGRDTLPQLLALLARATRAAVPGFRARRTWRPWSARRSSVCMRLRAVQRTGPYLSRNGAWIATRRRRNAIRHRSAAQLPWSEKIESPGVMDLIEVADVRERLDALMAAGATATIGSWIL